MSQHIWLANDGITDVLCYCAMGAIGRLALKCINKARTKTIF